MSIFSVSQKQAAELLSTTPRTIRTWEAEGLPRLADGRYSGPELVAWYVRRHRAQDGELDPAQERARRDREMADKLAMENERRRGLLIDAAAVEATLLGMAAHLAREHDALPGRLASELAGISDPAVIRARLLAECRSIREGLAQFSVETADALERAAGQA